MGKKGKYATAPKSEKSKKKAEKKASKGANAAAEKAAAAEEAAKAARLGRPVPEMYPDIIATFGTNEKKIAASAKQILVENLTVLYHGYELLSDTTLTLSWGNRYGLIARNGEGKSTLLRALASGIIPRPANIDVYTVERGMDKTDKTALEAVLEVDQEKQELETEIDRLTDMMGDESLSDDEQSALSDELSDLYERLDELGADTAEARAASILNGLGFTKEMQAKKTSDFSGGWLMRISLAKALYLNPSFLILDEPTNHLDMGAVVWLEQYLKKFNRILLMVSHSQDFLNGVCSNMILLRDRKLEYFGGNYDSYVRTRSEKEVRQQKAYESEQAQIADMKNYIARFGHGSAKLAKQAQSKEKTLEKMMRSGLTEKVKDEKRLKIKFYPCGKLPPPVLQLQEVGFAYPNCELLYTGVDRGLDCDSRVCLVGPNGCGKSTLCKLLMGDLMPTEGMVRRHHHLKIASYQQHTVDQLPFEKSPLEYMHEVFPKDLVTGEVNSVDKIRSMVGRFGITGAAQTMKISQLSDGQRSRLVFAVIAEQRPNFIFFDEPTNNIDMETIDSLADAINEFEGGVCVVSHDIRLISQVAQEIWLVENGQVITFPGDIADFKKQLERQVQETGSASNTPVLQGDSSRAKTTPTEAPKPAPKPKASISVAKPASNNAAPKPASETPPAFEGLKPLKKKDDEGGLLQPLGADEKKAALAAASAPSEEKKASSLEALLKEQEKGL
ncbi:ABC transporter ATP-binding protein ARB1 [Hondaea fermentalgiana]|uniref:ABC transporter ATP-binding protein ARB1 n=1 Tax=Hondaea fermentalgiana TaxID=2315210 RepID=A0A2R5GDF3_9STRA|nr:ABC transporter ATP-binding protein ARB1 [Hondaea fermentalgiana]|eukprot:GBG28982.1 ABC transporter ATP-binding protein ARB1 [Hondaea fermentalgiana]